MTQAMERRAVDVQMQLADKGHHRGTGIAHLLIADLTGQPVERLRIE